MNIRSPSSRYVAILIINALFWHPVVVLADGIVVAPGAGNTALDRAGNGVPVVDIATPNGSGLSHNRFSDYNVDEGGVILNNATGKLQSTQLGGLIVGNPNLRDQAARLIVNEVNGGRPSRLEGYTEVAGAAADVVVANPYGITCNGCGFINSPRVTLSTGRPIIEDGDLARFAVDQGRVAIEGLGLDATQVDQFDIITRAAEINAELHANRLNVITGVNDVDAETLATTARQGTGEAPALAIDASALGGMYAGSIRLVGTESGVGVRLAGDMAASEGDILIDANGHLRLADASSTGQAQVNATRATLGGDIHASQAITVRTRDNLDIDGNLTSGGDITLDAGRRLANQGAVIAGIENDVRRAGADLTLRADRLDNHGWLDATERLVVTSADAHNHGRLLADEIAVDARQQVTNTGTIQGERVTLTSRTVTNRGQAATLAATASLELDTDHLDNLGGSVQFAQGQDVRLDLERLDNSGGTLSLDDGDLQGRIGTLTNRGGRLTADSIDLDAASLDNSSEGLIAATDGDLTLDVVDTLDNSQGRLQASGDVALTATTLTNSDGTIGGDTATLTIAQDLSNDDGVISAEHADLALEVGTRLGNAAGHLQARTGTLTLSAGEVDNRGGVLLAEQVINARVGGALDNGAQGVLTADAITLDANQLTNHTGSLVGDLVTLTLARLDNDAGLISANQGLHLDLVGALSNRAGRLQVTDGELVLNGGATLDNTQGTLVADSLRLTEIGTIVNRQGELVAGTVDIQAASLDNSSEGLIAATDGDLTLDVVDTLDNSQGRLQASGDVTLTATTLTNSDGTIGGDTATLTIAQDLSNDDGVISAEHGDLALEVGTRLGNAAGHLQARTGTLTLSAGEVDNRGGVLLAEQVINARVGGALDNGAQGVLTADAITLDAGQLTNHTGSLIGDLVALTLARLDNDAGLISANQGLHLDLVGALSNRAGRLQVTDGELVLNGGTTLDNTQGILVADSLRLTEIGTVTNRQGKLIADAIALDAASLDNTDDGLVAAGVGGIGIALSGALDNRHGKVQSDQALAIAAQHIDNRNGAMLGDGFQLTAEHVLNRGGAVLGGTAGSRVTLVDSATARLDNRDGAIDALDGQLTLRATAGTLDNQGGSLSGERLAIDVATFVNDGGQAVAGAEGLSLSAQQLDNRNGLVITQDGALDTYFGLLQNQGGALQGDSATFTGDTLVNADDGLIAGLDGQVTMVLTNGLDNRDGRVLANGTLGIDPPFIDNRQGQLAGRTVRLEAGHLDNAGGMIEATENLTVDAERLTNTDGELRALGGDDSRLTIAGTFDNQDGRVELASDDATLEAGTLRNGQGQLQHAGGGLFQITANRLANVGGQMQGTGSGQVTLDRLDDVGQWQFNGALGFDLDQGLTLAAGDRIATAGRLTLNLASLDNRGELLANDALTLTTSGDITNHGLISTQGDLAVSARHLTQRGGRLAGGGTSTYRLGGTLDNLGRLTGVGNVDITTAYLDNRGTLGSQADLRIVSRGGIDNGPDTLLFAGGDMTLRGTRLVNRYGDIYSRGNLDVARNDRHALADRLENRSGTIEAEGDIALYAEAIVNTKDEYQEDQVLQERSLSATAYAVTSSHREYYSGGRDSDKGWIWVSDGVLWSFAEYELQEQYKTEVAQDSPAARLVAGGDMAIRAGDLENANSLIAANGNLHIQADTLENRGAGRESVFKLTSYGDPQALAGLTPNEEECRPFSPCFDYRNGSRGYWVKESLLPDDLAASVADWNASDGLDAQGQDLPLPEALAGSEQLSQVVTRTPLDSAGAAVIQAGGRVSIDVANRLDNGQIENQVREQLSGNLADTAPPDVVDSLDITLNRRTDNTDTRSARELHRVARSDASATDSLASTDLDVAMVEAGQSTVDPGEMAVAPGDVASYRDVPFERIAPTQLASFRLPRGRYGLFVRNTSPHSRYLVETNPEFTSAERLMGSDYLLDKLGYSDDGAYQLLGDGRYESRLIRDAVLANTGQRFLEDSLSDDYAQYRHLMDNAVAARDALQLSVGVGLTPAQTAALTHDIVWLEEQQVDGETVLAPVLYLAQVDERNVRGASLIQGRDIDLITGGDLVNVGTIRAGDDLTALSGGSILQGGLVEAGQRLALSARDSIRNALAGEIRGGRVSLAAREGDIVNDRTAVTAGHARSYATYLDQGGLISARDGLDLSAGRDIVNRAEIASQGDVAFLAGRDIVSEAVADARRQVNGYAAGVGEGSERTTQLGASISAGGDAALSAGRDMRLTASTIDADGALSVAAARDIRLDAAEDTTHDWGGTGSRRWYGRQRTDERTTTQVGSQLSSGGDTDLGAGRDVRLAASEIDSRAGLAITAGNDIVLDAAENTSQTQTDEWRRESQTRTVEQAGSTLTASDDIALQAQRHLTAIASRAEAGGDLALDAGGDLTLAAAANVNHHESHTRTTDWISRRVRQQGSDMLAGGDLTLRSGRDLRLIASQAAAGDDVVLIAGRDVELLAANDQDYSLYEKEERGLFSSRYQRDEINDLRAVGSHLESGNDLTVISGVDQRYQGARLEAGNDLTLASGGTVRFEAASDVHTEAHEKHSGNFAWQSSRGEGRTDETLRQSELLARGELVIQAADGIVAEVPEIDAQSVRQTVDALVAANPDLAWLQDMEARGDIDWRRVRAIHDSWEYEQSGLGAGAALAISIVAAAVAGPAVAGALQAAGSGAVVAAAGGAMAGSLAGTGAVSVINHRGDLGATFDDTFSSDSLRGAATAAISAGIANGLDGAWGSITNPTTGATGGLDLGTLDGIGRFAGQRATQAALDAGVRSAIEGGSVGDHLDAGLEDALAHVVSGVLFHAVGDQAQRRDWAEGGPEKVALHALVGGSVAEAMGGDFRSGALAAGASEALVDRLVEDGYERQVLSNTVAQLVGIVAAEFSGGDANEGAFIAGQVESYNRQLHPRERDLIAEQAATMEAQLGSPRLEDVTWSDMMALVSGAQLDAQQAARFDTLLAELDNTSNANNPLYQRFLEDLQTAQAAMGGLAARHQNESLSWADGQPITAHGEEVTAFQATQAQYRDGGLFGQVEAGTAGLGALGLFTQYGAGQASQHYGEVADIGASAPPMDEVYDRAYWNALGGGAESSTIDVDLALALTGTGAGARAVSLGARGLRSWLQARVSGRTVIDNVGPSPRTPVGRLGQQTNFPNPNAPAPRNSPTTINGRDYSGHAIDRMQERGFTPSVIENAIKSGARSEGNKPNTTVFADGGNKLRVIINSETGRVITVIGGGK
ncbi:DUF637 domain-containing protein [Halomonas sp. H5]|uniref:two-partner secretion domain-containing protein n=1 Tax=Halomonas sp. H5 TaxID=3423910 RepID=UPI003D36E1D9